MLNAEKSHGLLLIDVAAAEETIIIFLNNFVLDSLLHDHDLKNCKIFHGECSMTQCCMCYHYGHITITYI